MNVIIPLVVVALLFVGFFIATQYRTVTCVIRSVCVWMARSWLLLSWACLQIAHLCMHGCVACLNRHEDTETETPPTVSFLMSVAIARLVHLLMSGITLIAGFPLDILHTVTSYGLAFAHPAVQLDSLIALIVVLMPDVRGWLVLETLGILPSRTQLLPLIHKGKLVMWLVRCSTAVLLITSLGATIPLHVYTQCQVLADCTSDPSLQLYVFGGFNTLLVVAACVVGLISVIMVLLGLAGVAFAGGYGMFLLLHVLCNLVGNCLASFAQDRNAAGVSISSQEAAFQTPLLPTTIRQDIRNRTNQESLSG